MGTWFFGTGTLPSIHTHGNRHNTSTHACTYIYMHNSADKSWDAELKLRGKVRLLIKSNECFDCVCVCLFACMCTCECACVCTCVRACVRVYVRACTVNRLIWFFTHTHTHTHSHTHTNICRLLWWCADAIEHNSMVSNTHTHTHTCSQPASQPVRQIARHKIWKTDKK